VRRAVAGERVPVPEITDDDRRAILVRLVAEICYGLWRPEYFPDELGDWAERWLTGEARSSRTATRACKAAIARLAAAEAAAQGDGWNPGLNAARNAAYYAGAYAASTHVSNAVDITPLYRWWRAWELGFVPIREDGDTLVVGCPRGHQNTEPDSETFIEDVDRLDIRRLFQPGPPEPWMTVQFFDDWTGAWRASRNPLATAATKASDFCPRHEAAYNAARDAARTAGVLDAWNRAEHAAHSTAWNAASRAACEIARDTALNWQPVECHRALGAAIALVRRVMSAHRTTDTRRATAEAIDRLLAAAEHLGVWRRAVRVIDELVASCAAGPIAPLPAVESHLPSLDTPDAVMRRLATLVPLDGHKSVAEARHVLRWAETARGAFESPTVSLAVRAALWTAAEMCLVAAADGQTASPAAQAAIKRAARRVLQAQAVVAAQH